MNTPGLKKLYLTHGMPTEVMAKIKAFEKPIFITRPNSDSKEVYGKFDEIWDSQWLTHFSSKRLRFEINKVILNII
jgi:hypothetical protein